uniref:hypothetical protein n=1 Tax=Candidatus Stercorousia sp. TaxID=3048886 RepID=UPI0040257D7F
MNEKMKTALLQWCERHADKLDDWFIVALDDLVTTVVTTTETPFDDGVVLPIKTPVLEILDEFLKNKIDKIDGVEGNLGAE